MPKYFVTWDAPFLIHISSIYLPCCFGVYARALLVPICRLHCFIPCLNHISKVNNVTDNYICLNHLQWDITITAQNLSTATLFVEIIGATGSSFLPKKGPPKNNLVVLC
jgi:hypothetical protein